MKKSTKSVKRDYQSLVRSLSRKHPSIASSLRKAHNNRLERLERLLKGARLTGLEALNVHLTEMEKTFRSSPDLENISFLIDRAKLDFEKALEAALSGLHSVASDAMRDVMEIEFLLRDFTHEPARKDEWLRANEKERYNRFKPVVLRQRYANRFGNKPEDMAEAVDYKGHSMFLHVSPIPYPFGGNGISKSNDVFVADTCFWDMFEHARRLVFIIHELVKQFHPDATYNPVPNDELPEIREAWERTQEMQSIFLALVQASKEQKSEEEK